MLNIQRQREDNYKGIVPLLLPLISLHLYSLTPTIQSLECSTVFRATKFYSLPYKVPFPEWDQI